MKILLFDMDDVLILPGAYHRALQETVRLVATAIGYPELHLSRVDIQAFESAGVYSEWDTSAICTALLLDTAWKFDRSITMPGAVNSKPGKLLPAIPPNFIDFAENLRAAELQDLQPLARAEHLLLDGQHLFTPAQYAQIRSILRQARAADGSLTHCTFQELVLGSEVFSQTYQRPAVLNVQSYLLSYDMPLVRPECILQIQGWLSYPAHKAAIFTSRPSKPLPGVFSTPEAEMGAALVGLENVPILGLGSLLWLSQERQAGPQAFVKPSSVHALSALLLALGHTNITCLQEASALALDEAVSPIWNDLQGAEIAVFDDSPAGLRSAVTAQTCLARAGISFQMDLFGIAGDSQKVIALQNQGAETFPDLSKALNWMDLFAGG